VEKGVVNGGNRRRRNNRGVEEDRTRLREAINKRRYEEK
jgi:hypothetical protein